METAAAAASWSGFTLAFSGRRLGKLTRKVSITSFHFLLNTRLNYTKLSGGRVLQKPVGMYKSRSELQHDFEDSDSYRYLKKESTLLLIGLDFRSAPLETLEKVSISYSELPSAVDELFGATCVEEAVILSTRDQFEIYAVAKTEHIDVQEIIEWMAKKSGIPVSVLQNWCYTDYENHAARHLFEVAAGLHSHFLGEGQILAQIKGVVKCLRGAQTFRSIMSELFRHAISVGRLVRSQIASTFGRVPVGSAAVELALSKLPDDTGTNHAKVLIIGAGRMSLIVMKNLVAKGFNSITIVNRTSDRIYAIRNEVKGVEIIYRPFEDLVSCIGEADVIFTCVASEQPLILEEHVEKLNPTTPGLEGLKLFFDVSIPRGIDVGISQFPFLRLFDINDIEEIVQHYKNDSQWKSVQAQRFIDQRVSKLESWKNAHEMFNILRGIKACLGGARMDAVYEQLLKMGDDVPRSVCRALETFSWDMRNRFFNVLLAQMLGPLGEKN